MKQKFFTLRQSRNQAGFTIIELLAVISIMVVLSTVIILDFNRQKAARAVVLAKNETVTNLRKVQSYMLSSRNLPTGQAVKFYVVEFANGSSSYSVNAVDTNYNYHSNLETVYFPTGVNVSSLTAYAGSDTTFARDGTERGTGSEGNQGVDNFGDSSFDSIDTSLDNTRVNPPGDTTAVDDGGGTVVVPSSYSCVQVIFSAPFGTMYARRVIAPGTCGSGVVELLRNPVELAKMNQGITYVNFQGVPGSAGAKYIQISPITGQITAF